VSTPPADQLRPTAEILQALPFGVALIDSDQRLVFVNNAYLGAVGLPDSSGVIGQSFEAALRAMAWRGMLGSGDPEEAVRAVLGRDRSKPYVRHLHYPNGRSFDTHSAPLPGGGFMFSTIETTGLVRGQDEVAAEAARVRAAIALARVGLAAFSPERKLLLHNSRFASLLGLPAEAVVPGCDFGGLIAQLRGRPEFADIEGVDFLKAQKHVDRMRADTMRRVRPNGQAIDVSSDPLPDGGWTITITDISALAQAEDDARRRAAMLHSILDNVPHGVCVYGPTRRVTMFNRAYVDVMHGAPVAVGDSLEEVIHRRAASGEYGPGAPEAVFTEQMAHDITRLQVRRRQRPNGTTIDVRTAPLPDGGHVSVVTDVTSLTLAENELLRRAGEMDVMLANIRHGITLFDADSRLVAANRMASELLNLPAGFLVPGRTEEDVLQRLLEAGEFGESRLPAALRNDRSQTDRGQSQLYRRATRNGRTLEIRTDPAPGNGVVTTYTDVTESEQAQAEQRRAQAAAEAANKAKSRFLATMSHELRTPLNAVIGFSEALLRQADAGHPERIAEFATAIHDSGRQLLGLINTILDVARIESGRFEMSADRVDVGRLVRTSMRLAEPSFQAGEIALRLDLPEEIPSVRADERRLQQVLGNLLSNAAKFTPAGGETTLGVMLAEDGELIIRVGDTGIGIPKPDLERVFEPFIQLDGELTRRFQGAGLGLYMSRSLVEAHGGKLRLRSEVGVGTVAEVVLPAWRLLGEGSNVSEGVA